MKINRKDAKALCGLGGFAVKKNFLPFSSSVVTERSWAIPYWMGEMSNERLKEFHKVYVPPPPGCDAS
ncbi:MAG: hypothetical protein GW893_17090 [Armatimonadetes bacterium]|nr:hypothetical protein [Armatimonadota bacterium]